jgi:hypothetical protein
LPFLYPKVPHERRHGPRGYRNYESYKPWLRDEFSFRCIYCLCRERWFPDGDDCFSVDHLESQKRAPQRRTDYENLVYACCQCNASRQDCDWLMNPCDEPMATHLEVQDDGTIRALTAKGKAWIQACRLDRPKLTEFRKGLLALVRDLTQRQDQDAVNLLRHCLGFPDNLPRLDILRPPGGNSRPEGIARSALEQKLRGELAETYER